LDDWDFPESASECGKLLVAHVMFDVL